MKKILFILMLSVSICSCNNGQEDPEGNKPSDSTHTPQDSTSAETIDHAFAVNNY